MKVLVTGARGFVGRNLVATLEAIRDAKDKSHNLSRIQNPQKLTIYEYDVDTEKNLLDTFCSDCDFVFNLAGVNRPKETSEFMSGNFGFASELLNTLKKHGNTCPVMLSSSVQASLTGRYADSEYGKSKKSGEDLFFSYAKERGAKVLVYRFPNLFGKWCKPNYNSAVATFCHNVANDLPIQVNDPSVKMNLVYIDDLVDEMIRALNGEETRDEDFCCVPIEYEIKLGFLAEIISGFPKIRGSLEVPKFSDSLTKKLYSTWLSYLPADKFIYNLHMNIDDRGSFTEILRTSDRGQFSVNISKPNITKGNHWHHTKNEKFVVVKGNGLIQLRKIGKDENGNDYPVVEYHVSGEKIQAVEMIPGYTHNIINLSDTEDLVTFMWANECFDSNKPDTFFEEV
ncbi:polysaccharide biosynthesis C-terminal domain-containing protein [Scatolibacter rhodanostii]|uniref:polysaccharide biosynthesis C-terminal domain-containing protein n=1 Tax=Scatolibacter rhodanostii TaxID=2014781 RepID=UPI000C0829E4|nr:NAD-dependent epimerase/dehydratase family protein [Scatolibacter rhodanostii]